MLQINLLTSATELLFVFLIASVFILYFQYRQRYQYWRKLGVKQFNPIFPIGDLSTSGLGITSIYTRLDYLYYQLKKNNHKFGGIYFYNGPTFFPVSTDIIKHIAIKDFGYFMDRGVYINGDKIPVSVHLFSMKGAEWKNLRTKLSPAFSSGKLKALHNILLTTAENLVQSAKKSEPVEVNMKKMLSRFGIDLIASIAFGVECNSINNPNDEFPRMADMIFDAPIWDFVKLIVEEGLNDPGNIAKIFHTNKGAVKYFTDLVHKTVEYRDQNHVVRDDFMQVMLKLRDTAGITLEDIVAQCYLFFLAGYETTSTTTSFALHELAYNQQIQDDLREEIVKNVGSDVAKFNFETVLQLPLLDKVLKETLRKHPSVPIIYRKVVKPYKIPDTDIILEPGTPIVIPVVSLHRDPEYFPDPMKFDPERFNNDNINNIIPCSYMPFGEGPRNCIGKRLGVMQVKAGLSALLSNFRFYPAKDSKYELEFKASTTAPVLTVEKDVHLKMVKI